MGDFEEREFDLVITDTEGKSCVIHDCKLSNIPEIKGFELPNEVTINGILYRRADEEAV